MKILVYPHELEIGGSPTNAVELAAAVRGLGHEVLIVGTPGPLQAMIDDRALRFIPIPAAGRGSFRSAVIGLRAAIKQTRPDIVHAYEYRALVEALMAARGCEHLPIVCTDMSMSVPATVPSSVSLIVGTSALRREATLRKVRKVEVIEPPVDMSGSPPAVAHVRAFVARLGLDPGAPLVVMVSRLIREMKGESLIGAIEAVGMLPRSLNAQLLIVGDGELLPQLRFLGEQVNEQVRRRAVVAAGAMLDPALAYGAADVVIGMGHSVLRGMSYGKPAIVVGQHGFVQPVDAMSLQDFLDSGFYGEGQGGKAAPVLAEELARLLGDGSLRRRLGLEAKDMVADRFDLADAATHLVAIYAEAVGQPRDRWTTYREASTVSKRLIAVKGRMLRRSARAWVS